MKKLLLAIAILLVWSAAVHADSASTYKVTITNITKAQTFTPILAATHRPSASLFKLGAPAIEALAELAESGATGPLEDYLLDLPGKVGDTETTDGLLGPGQSVSFLIENGQPYSHFSFAAMLIPTNDTFVSLNNIRLPRRSDALLANAYDSGSEKNDESCASIPGPFCMGVGAGADGGEGFVHIANGIAGIGDLMPETFDWRGPVARVVIRRLP